MYSTMHAASWSHNTKQGLLTSSVAQSVSVDQCLQIDILLSDMRWDKILSIGRVLNYVKGAAILLNKDIPKSLNWC